MTNKLSNIPSSTRCQFSDEVNAAIDKLCALGLDEMEAFYQAETGEFIGLGFIGPGGTFTRLANVEAIVALEILEEEYAKELRELRFYEFGKRAGWWYNGGRKYC